MAYKIDCRLFTGYKPCRFKRSCDGCDHYDPIKNRIVVISLEAMGAVLRSTCLLPPILRSYPNSHITWITLKQCVPLLDNNPYIDRIITLEPKNIPLIHQLSFDILYAVDKSIEAGALAQAIESKKKFGFGIDSNGVIMPLSPEGNYQYQVGLDDNLKFFKNRKTETQQITETMGLKWERDSYIFRKTENESLAVEDRRRQILNDSGCTKIIGYNTGCSNIFSYKKFTVEKAIELVKSWRNDFPDCAVALLGGPEDTDRQKKIKEAFLDDPGVINTPTTDGLRSGIMWVDTADIVFSGCSLGLHIAIALGKPSIAWFGVSCSHEIDLYDRGIHLIADVKCTPCWKRSCENNPKCYDMVSISKILESTKALI